MPQLPCTVLLSFIHAPSLIYSFPPFFHPYILAFPWLVWPVDSVCATQTNKLLPNSVLDSTANLELYFGSTVIWGPCWHCTVEVHPQVICLATHKTQGFQFCFNFAVKIFLFFLYIKKWRVENIPTAFCVLPAKQLHKFFCVIYMPEFYKRLLLVFQSTLSWSECHISWAAGFVAY
jgi:hypothetical protein